MAKNSKLKFDLTGSTTNNPIDSASIYHSALISGGSKETFSQIVDVKDKARIRKHEFGDVLQADGCTFNDQGAGALSEKLVDACPIKVQLSVCQSTIEQSFLANSMRSGSNNADFLPAEFQTYFLSKLAEKMAADIEKIVWQGNTAVVSPALAYPLTLCDGLVAKMLADATVVDVANTTVTSSNVIVELNKIYVAIPAAVLFSSDLVLYVSSNIGAAYKQAVAAASAEAYYTKNPELTFLGIKMIIAEGLPADTAVAAETTNLFIITDLMSDFDDIKLLPQMDVTGDDTVRVTGRFKFAVDFAVGADIVLYS
jgi:hypothetical protein